MAESKATMLSTNEQILQVATSDETYTELHGLAPNAGCVAVEPAHTAIGTAAALDEAAADREQAELHGAAASYGRMLVLLREARQRLDDSRYQELVGQIDAELHGCTEADLVWERLPSGEFAWLRAEGEAA